jgi:hypothetical protein
MFVNMKVLSVALLAAVFAVSAIAPASAQQTQSIGPGGIGQRNIGPNPNAIGPGPGGPGFGGCLTTVIAGNTYLEVCPFEYNAQAGGIYCSGGVRSVGGGYNLQRGRCNAQGQFFLGGRLTCGGGSYCNWSPSPAAAAQGYFPEQVEVSYQ